MIVANYLLVELSRLSAGLTQGELAGRISKSQAFVSQVEAGERPLPDDLLDSWAAACSVPPSFLRRSDTPMSDPVAGMVHRRMATLPARPFNQVNAQVKQIALELDALFQEVEVVPAVELPVLPPGTGPSDAAAAVRRALRIPLGPVRDLTGLVESAAIPVVAIQTMHEKHSGVSHRGRWFDWMVALNANHPASRCRLTLAHELGHIVLEHDKRVAGDDQDATLLEDEAYAFGAELLFPEQDARRELRNLTFRRLVELKQRWRVAISFIIRRARECEMISERQAVAFYMELSRLPGGRRREPAEFESEEPSLPKKMIEGLQAEGYSIHEIAEIMTVTDDGLRSKYLNEHGHLRPLRQRRPTAKIHLEGFIGDPPPII
jgi:Zn-dependent peptidase ImmA (M78 family)/transcriptional regulator with XRE-family HTH domain